MVGYSVVAAKTRTAGASIKYFTNWLCRILAGLYSGGTDGIAQVVKNSYERNRGQGAQLPAAEAMRPNIYSLIAS